LLPQKILRVAELAEGSRLAAINRLRSEIEQVGMRVGDAAVVPINTRHHRTLAEPFSEQQAKA